VIGDPGMNDRETRPVPATPDAGKQAMTRRSFLGAAGRRARYVTPLILTLVALNVDEAHASVIPSDCLSEGLECENNTQCCPGLFCLIVNMGVMRCVP
jgi:hypothetical protein